MPTYYIMDLDQGMAETVAPAMPSATAIAACTWLPDDELAVYSAEYSRTGFQGGLQWYRRATRGQDSAEIQLFAGRTIDVPSLFMAGKSDWGSINALAPSSGCRRAPARICTAVIYWRGQVTGCSRSSRKP